MKTNLRFRFSLFFLLSILAYANTALAQTPGLIYRPATAGGAKVLDPNGDGYVSVRPTGFVGSTDEGAANSEIPYRPFPALSTEPIGDLNTGSTGSHTDLAPPATPLTSPSTGSPFSAYYSGTNLLIRARLGGSSTASKGYSVLIDADQTFNGTGTNPGFEYEVLLASNFAVQVIRHTPTGSSVVFNGSVDQYSQKAVAASTAGGNTDYFYDFYVPLSAFGSGITADTPLRMSGITITSAQSGITGTVSDVGGVNFQAYNYDAPAAWRALINGFPATSLNSLQTSGFPQLTAAAPTVTSPILANSTSISGTSTEAVGSVVTVYRNGTAICGTTGLSNCPTVSANGTWTLAGISSTLLAAGDVITATVSPTGKTVSPPSAPVAVSTGPCLATPAPKLTGITGTTGNRFLVFNPGSSGYHVITVYNLTDNTSVTTAPLNLTAGTPYPSTSTGAPTALQVAQGKNYVITSTPTTQAGAATGCQSLRSNQLCFSSGGNFTTNPHTVTISGVTYNSVLNSSNTSAITEVPTNVTSLTVSINFNGATQPGNVVLYRNGTATNISEPYVVGTTTKIFNITGVSLAAGDILAVRTVQTAGCSGASTTSNFLTVQPTTASPTINSPSCGFVTSLTGTSTEPAGTVLQFYTGGTAGERNGTLVTQSGTSTPITATVTSTGAWAVDLSSVAGGGITAGTAITARAKTPGKVRSVNSASVSSTSGTTGVLAINSIAEGATTVAGTGPASAAGAAVTLYIAGTPFPTPVLVASDGTWTVNGISEQELFAGATVTATFTPRDGCESAKSTPVVVSCVPPSSLPSVEPKQSAICSGGSAIVTVSGTEEEVSYRLVVESGTSPNLVYTETGSSVLGTGGTITLVSGPITSNATLRVRAIRVSGTACSTLLSGSVGAVVNSLPPNTNQITISYGTTSGTSVSGCAGQSPVVTLQNAQAGLNYELIDDKTKERVLVTTGNNPITPTQNGNISFSVANVSTTTTYAVRVTNPQQINSCSTEVQNKVTYTVTGPQTNQLVTISRNQVCPGGSAVIYLQTNNDGATYQLYEATTNTPVAGTAENPTRLEGNGQRKSVVVSPSATTTYYFIVTAAGGGCTANLINRVVLEVSNTPIAVTAGASRTVCSDRVTLQGTDPAPGEGRWSIDSSPGNNINATILNPTNFTTEVTGLTSGTYLFTWTINTSCGSTNGSASASVRITINCPTVYNISPPKYLDKYNVGDILATASDPDGGIGSSTIVLGSGFFPTEALELLMDGTIRVVNTAFLETGSYSFSVSSIDQRGVETITPIRLRVYGESPAIVPLPVELVYFTGIVDKGQVKLQWVTASEENNRLFEVERSADGESFESIGNVAGAGTTSQPQQYQYTDAQPLEGTAYYRLKQVDMDGKFAYSRVVDINVAATGDLSQLQVWPNPFDQELNLEVEAPTSGEASVILTDLKGQQVYSGKVQLQPGQNKLTLPIRGLSTGMYILRLQGNNVSGTAKVVKR